MAAVTGDDEDNLVICQMAKHHFDVPRTIARVNNPKNEALFRHLGVDELISPTRMILGSIEQDIPVHELLHLAALGEGELELIEAHLQSGSPAIGRAPRDLSIPEGCSLFAVIRNGVATPLRPDTIMLEGDKVIAIGKTECQELLHAQLIGEAVDGRRLSPDGSPGPTAGHAGVATRRESARPRRTSQPDVAVSQWNIGARTLDNAIVRVLACGMSETGPDRGPRNPSPGGVRHDDRAPRLAPGRARLAPAGDGSAL